MKVNINRDGGGVTERLKHVQDLPIRKGIFRSLQKIDLVCIANRNYY